MLFLDLLSLVPVPCVPRDACSAFEGTILFRISSLLYDFVWLITEDRQLVLRGTRIGQLGPNSGRASSYIDGPP